MVVEDEPDIYDVLLAMFELWGIEGVAFVDGGEAISWIDAVDEGRVHGDLPELAILDIRLPEASGPEVGNRIRKSTKLQNIAIVLITAYRPFCGRRTRGYRASRCRPIDVQTLACHARATRHFRRSCRQAS